MTYMIISGFGIFLIFAANQAATQTIPGIYPPFGLLTITVLNIAAFFMLLGIYNLQHLFQQITTCVNLYVNMLWSQSCWDY